MVEFTKDSIEQCLDINSRTCDVLGVNHMDLAEFVLRTVPMATVVETGEILICHNGLYVRGGNEYIRSLLVKCLKGYRYKNGRDVYTTYLLNQVTDIIKGLTYVESSKFDNDLHIINMDNGLYNWYNGEFTPHDPLEYQLSGRRPYFSRIQIPLVYNPHATCPHIERMLRNVLHDEDRTKVMELLAYLMYREYTLQKAFILLGPGGTGKTIFLDLLRNFTGARNCSSVSMHDLEKDRFATADLHLKLVNLFGDMEQTELPNINIMKMLTSNKDVIRAQRKGEHAFDFVNYAKLVFATNQLPMVRDDTTGFYRRVEILPFEHVFTKAEYDADLLKAITDPVELSGLFNLVMPYLKELIERNEFTNASSILDMTIKYKSQSDPVGAFVERHVEEDADAFPPTKQEMYDAYCLFCKKHNVTPLHKNWFGKAYVKRVEWHKTTIKNVNGRQTACWANTGLIRLNELT